jgi:hypothetical protein
MVLGRQSLVIELTRLALEGETVLIYGRRGAGKTAVLEAVESEIRRFGRPCGIAPRTEVLADVVDALAECYPEVSAPNRLATRARLRAAVRERPAVLLLDHLAASTPPVRSYLRTLRGTGLGVILAANVEHARDRAQVRSLRLAYREIEVLPLGRRVLARVLDAALEKKPPQRVLAPSERVRLLEVAAGRPGVVALLLELLDRTTPTGEGQIQWELLRCEVSSAIAGAYVRGSPGLKLELVPKEESECRSRARGSGSAST